MTLIECFTESHIDNIAACLRLQPDRMVMVGNAAEMDAPVRRYKKLLKQRGIATEVTLCDVQSMDLGEHISGGEYATAMVFNIPIWITYLVLFAR